MNYKNLNLDQLLSDPILKNSISFNEEKAIYSINNEQISNIFKLKNKQPIYEKDLTLNEINLFKKVLDKTTLTDKDIDILYNYSKKAFGTNFSRNQFPNISISKLFPGLRSDEYVIDKIIPKACKYLNLNSSNNIETFISNNPSTSEALIRLSCISCCIILLVIFIYALLWGYNKYVPQTTK